MLTIDGRVGEGGGQLVRTAAALSALTGQPLRVDNVRGNRSKGGLRPQHAAAVEWLADMTGASTTGIETGSTSFTFRPKHRLLPVGCGSPEMPIVLRAATEAASAALMLQAVLPYILFGEPANEAQRETVYLRLHGGTHVPQAPTYDYLDQVLFPTLEDWLGVRVERRLVVPCWNTGPATSEPGHVELVIHRPRQLVPRFYSLTKETETIITSVEATVYAPSEMLEQLTDALSHEVSLCGALARAGDLQFRSVADSGYGSRLYVLLVAQTAGDEANGIPVRRWGRDYLEGGSLLKGLTRRGPVLSKRGKKGSKSSQGRGAESETSTNFGPVCDRIAQKVVGYLAKDVEAGGCGDEYLQDQVVVFQALAAGETSFWRGETKTEVLEEAVSKLSLDNKGEEDKLDDMSAPFGQGSLHTATARWVTAQLLPGVQWSGNGTVCTGVAWGS